MTLMGRKRRGSLLRRTGSTTLKVVKTGYAIRILEEVVEITVGRTPKETCGFLQATADVLTRASLGCSNSWWWVSKCMSWWIIKLEIYYCIESMILIQEPGLFYCEPDEDYFFTWLKAIPAVKRVTATPKGLELIIEEPMDKNSFYELIGLMTRYGLDKKCLRPICDSHPDPWFKDSKNYWYESVYGNSEIGRAHV